MLWQSGYGQTRLTVRRQGTEHLLTVPGKARNMHRVQAELKLRSLARDPGPIPRVIPARAVLSDFREDGVGLFAARLIAPGAEIALRIEEPKPFFCVGRVIACCLVVRLSNIISEVRYDYRVRIRFLFSSAEERTWIRQYAREMSGSGLWLPSAPPVVSPAKTVETDAAPSLADLPAAA